MNMADGNRNRLGWYGLGALVALLVVVGWLTRQRARVAPMPGHAGAPFQVVGFYSNPAPSATGPTARSDFLAHWRQLTTVSPLWFSVTRSGAVVDTGYDGSLVAFAHRHGRAVLPLFVNAAGSSTVLWSAATRHRAAANIQAVIQHDHLDGANLDFELLKPSSRADLSRFVGDVEARLARLHKALAVSVFPLRGMPASVNGAYDYGALARYANYLVIMAYDHHYSGGPPGPVAPYAWVKDNVAAALRVAPAKKLVLAIGMYGYDWVNSGKPGAAPTVTDVQAEALARSRGVTPRYVGSLSQNTFTYTAGGVSHVVWYMGDRSAAERVRLAHASHLGGIALWQLGDEDPRFWRVL